MARPSAPSLPTRDQIARTFKAVNELQPGSRIVRVGPEGIEFAHPDVSAGPASDAPFSAEPAR